MRRILFEPVVSLVLLVCLPTSHSQTNNNNNISSEAKGLLAFKQYSVQSDPSNLLTNWTSSNASPCSWSGVYCSRDGHVLTLNLSNAGLAGGLHLPTLTSSLPYLKHVYLQGNNFFAADLSTSNSSSCALETLDLSSNSLADPLPANSFFLSCPHLAYVNLSRNTIPGGTLHIGPSLLQLDVSRNHFSDPAIVTSSLSSCQNLILLNFSNNKLSGKLGSSATPLPCKALSAFDLSYNRLSGEIPTSFVADSPMSLTFLDLSNNNFSGKFSDLSFGRCANLSYLSLSGNSLAGTSFPANISACSFLEVLDLSHNYLQMSIPGPLLGSFRFLKHLSLAHNQFFGDIPLRLAFACGTLIDLDLSFNKLTGGLPPGFISCTSLQSLNLGSNLLSGDFLAFVVSSIKSLRFLYVPFNNITGQVPQSLTNCTQLQELDLSSNSFTGSVPSWFCPSSNTSNLQKLLLANNYLSGQVPPEIGSCRNLKSIDLSFNNLEGPIPLEIWNLPNLADLVMWANNLTGEIPEGICVNGGNFETLILNNNHISGPLPQSIAYCTNLIWVSLSSNLLTGEIPSGIGNLVNLAILEMGNNSLTGLIPPEIGKCRSLIWLDLNSNDLTGPIPHEIAQQTGLIVPGIVSGKQFAFVRNEGGTACRGAEELAEFEGIRIERLESFPMVHSCPTTRIHRVKILYTFAINGSMIYLDLAYNSLSGTIPEDLGSMAYLQVLNLGHNRLTGNIPDSFGGLREIGVLDLSHNDLSGFIPGSLGTLSFLSDLDVSNNNLTGPIPSAGQFKTFLASIYENNSGLCGVPLPPCGSGDHPRGVNTRVKKQNVVKGMVFGIVFFASFILALTLALYRVEKYRMKEAPKKKYLESLPTSGRNSWKLSGVPEPLSINIATFEKSLHKLNFAHLLEATNGFSADSLIGSGGFGEVYKAQLRDGSVIAIKKLFHEGGQGDREFVAEMETIGKIKHQNLVPLLGYCKVGDERLLVYEYMRWGSLESVLHGRSKGGGSRLDWAARRKIAMGSARGLSFLHHGCFPHIIHRDIKSSNVLLDDNFEARISDFGMARLLNPLDTHLSVSALVWTPGYVPPEYYHSFMCSTRGDVYSYGVILLELLSGKKPVDPSEFGDDKNIVGWAKQLYKEKRSNEILDVELTSSQKSSEVTELHQYLRIAFHCLDDRPFRRPTMRQVMVMFKELQVDLENDILDGLSLEDAAAVDDEFSEEESLSC